MKILQINTFYKHGSTGRIVYDIQKMCELCGYDNYVAFGCKTSCYDEQRNLCLQGWLRRKWNILKTRVLGRHGFYNKSETSKLINYINQLQPDIIHLHNIHNHFINIEILFNYIKEKNIPIIWTLHDCWPFTGWCSYFDYVKCNKWETQCNDCPSLNDYPRTWFFDRSLSNFNKKRKIFTGVNNLTLVTPSKWLASLTQKSFIKEYPTKVINNGVDIEIFKPVKSKIKEKLGVSNKNILLAIAANLAKRKGAEDLIKLPQMLEENEILIVLGVTQKQLQILPREKCIGITYTENIQELVELYSAADVFLNPTYEDNFPTTNIESLACGTPVITYNTGGSIEAINEETGYVVEQGDLIEMLRLSREIIKKGKSSYQNCCRNRAVEFYDRSKQYQEYIKLYMNILNDIKS